VKPLVSKRVEPRSKAAARIQLSVLGWFGLGVLVKGYPRWIASLESAVHFLSLRAEALTARSLFEVRMDESAEVASLRVTAWECYTVASVRPLNLAE